MLKIIGKTYDFFFILMYLVRSMNMLNKELMKFVEDLFLESIDIESVLKNSK